MTTRWHFPEELARRFRETFPTSHARYQEAKELFPDGVTHDLRNLHPFPIYIDRAEGSKKYDLDGHEIIDFWTGHGALLMGHAHPAVVEAVRHQIARGTHPGACHELEIKWGAMVRELIPSAERVRFVGSGTEATLMALRLARMHTGRPRVLKLAGHFHGWHDYLMGGVMHAADPATPGVPKEVLSSVVIIPPNDADLVEHTLREDDSIGCVILEPTGGHWGQVPIGPSFLRELRRITSELNRVLIFDEVITGFRVSPGGAQALHGVIPDLTTLAKILAGGLPGGCVAGRAEVMAHLESRPDHAKMPHPGTFNANPLSAAAGLAVLRQVANGEPIRQANEVAAEIRRRLNASFAEMKVNWLAYGDHSGFRIIPDYDGPLPQGEDFVPYAGDFEKLNRYPPRELSHAFRCAMLLEGVDPIGLSGLTMAVHTEEDIEKTVGAVRGALRTLYEEQ